MRNWKVWSGKKSRCQRIPSFQLMDGSLEAAEEILGNSGSATFTQNGGSHTVHYRFDLGLANSGKGAYDLINGSLTSSYEFIGTSGTGTFTQSGGTHTVGAELSLGHFEGSNGTYELKDGNLTVNIEEYIGWSGQGGFTQSGGSHAVSSWLYLGRNPGARGSHLLSGGNLAVGGLAISGGNKFIKSGGSHTVSSWLSMGGIVSDNATYELSGGSLEAKNELIAHGGKATFIQSNGTHTVTGTITLGDNDGDIGTYELTGGNLTTANLIVGNYGKGEFRQTGGTHSAASTVIGYYGPGTYTLTELTGLLSGPQPPTVRTGARELFTDFTSSFGSKDSIGNITGYHFTIFGFTLGADYRLRDDLVIGLGTGYYNTSATYKNSGGTVGISSIPFYAYVSYIPGSYYAIWYLGYTLNLYTLERNLTFGSINRTASGSPNGNQLNVSLETGYDFRVAQFSITPAVSLYYSTAWVDNFSEDGAGGLNLKVGAQSTDSVQTGVGVRLSRSFQAGRTIILPQLYAFYQHEFANASRGLIARLVQAGNTFVFQTDSPSRDFALLGAGLAAGLKRILPFRQITTSRLAEAITPRMLSAPGYDGNFRVFLLSKQSSVAHKVSAAYPY